MADTIDLLYKIQADNSDAKKKIDEQIAQLEKLKKTLTDTSAQKAVDKEIESFKSLSKTIADSNTQAEALGKTLKTTGDNFEKLNTQAIIDNFQQFSQTCLSITKQIANLGSSTVDSAKQIGGMENAIIRLSSSAEEGQKLVKFIEDLSLTNQKFSRESLLEAGKNLAKFDDNIKSLGINIQDLLPIITKFASVQGVDVSEASNTVAKALSGVRGGLMQAATQYGITKEKLIEYGAEAKSSGEIDKDATASKMAFVEALKEVAARSGEGNSAIGESSAATMKLKNAVTELKASIGEELLPYVTKVTGYLAEMAVNLTKLDGNTKLALAGIGGLAIGVTAAAGALSGIVGVLMRALTIAGEFGTLLASLPAIPILPWLAGISAFLVSGPAAIGACVIAVKLIVDWTNQWKIATANLKLTDTKKELDDYAIALQNVAKVMPGVATAHQAYNTVVSEGIENLEKDIQGQEKAKAALKAVAQEELNLLSQRSEEYKKLADLKQQLKDAEKEKVDEQGNVSVNEQLVESLKSQVAEQEKLVNKKSESINKVKEEKTELQGILNVIQGINDASQNSKGLLDDTDLAKMITHQKDLVEAQRQSKQQMVDTLENYKIQYKLTDDQILEIDKATIQAREKIKAEEEKLIKDQETKEKEAVAERKKAWTDYLSNLTDILKLGQISQKQYNDYIKQYYQENEADLQKDTDLKKEISKAYWDGEKTLADKDSEDKKKRYEEEVKQAEEKTKKLAEEAKKQAEEEKKQAEEVYKTKLSINQKILELNKVVNEKNDESRAANLQAELNYQQQILNSLAIQGESLLARYEAGASLNGAELKNLEIYIEQKKTVQAIGDQIDANASKELAAYESRKSAMLTYVEVAIKMGEMTAEQGKQIVNSFIEAEGTVLEAKAKAVIEKIKTQGIDAATDVEKQTLVIYQKSQSDWENTGTATAKRIQQQHQNINTEIKTGNQFIDDMISKMGDADKATQSTASSANALTSNLGAATTQAETLANKIETIGNITAGSSGGITGNFMTLEQMAASMPGTKAQAESASSQAIRNTMATTGSGGLTGGGFSLDAYNQAYADWQAGGGMGAITSGQSAFGTWQQPAQGYDNYSNDLVAQKVGSGIAGNILSKSAGDLVANVNTGMVQTVNSVLSAINPNLVAVNQAISSVNTALVSPSQAISSVNPYLLSVNQAVSQQAADYSESQTGPAGIPSSPSVSSASSSGSPSGSTNENIVASFGTMKVIAKQQTIEDMAKLIQDVKSGKVLAPPTITGGRLSVEDLEKQYNTMLEKANGTNKVLTQQEQILEDIGEQMALNAEQQITAFETAKSENEEFYSLMVELGKMSQEQAVGAMRTQIQEEMNLLYQQVQQVLTKTREQMNSRDFAVLKEYASLKNQLAGLTESSSSSSTSKVFSASDYGMSSKSSLSTPASSSSTSNYREWAYNTDTNKSKIEIGITINGRKVQVSSELEKSLGALVNVISNDRSIDL